MLSKLFHCFTKSKIPVEIQIYGGLGTSARGTIWGRVLEDKEIPAPKPSEPRLLTLWRNVQAMESDEIPFAKLKIHVDGQTLPTTCDEEGLFQVVVHGPLPLGRLPVSVELEEDIASHCRITPGELFVFPEEPGIAVVSDIDDTVLKMEISAPLRMVLRTFLTNFFSMEPFAHSAATFKVWANRGYPIIFISGSPINFYPRLTNFFSYNHFPPCVLLLKDFGLTARFSMIEQKSFKRAKIAEVMELLPGYRLLLVGDTGLEDPEVFEEFKQKSPDKIEAVMIHNLDGKTVGTRSGLDREKVTRSGLEGENVRRSSLEGEATVRSGLNSAAAKQSAFNGELLFDDYRSLARSLLQQERISSRELREIERAP